MAFSPDGKLLAGGSQDGTVRLWDPVTGQPVGAPLHAHVGAVGLVGVAFSSDGKLMVSADISTVRSWDLLTGRPVGAPLQGPGSSFLWDAAAVSPDGKLLATAGNDGTVRLWAVAPLINPYATLCADVGPPTNLQWTTYASGETEPKICA